MRKRDSVLSAIAVALAALGGCAPKGAALADRCRVVGGESEACECFGARLGAQLPQDKLKALLTAMDADTPPESEMAALFMAAFAECGVTLPGSTDGAGP